jgi:hypothetical protein
MMISRSGFVPFVIGSIAVRLERRIIFSLANVRVERRRAVGAPLADRDLWIPLANPASGVTTSAERCTG